MTAEVTYLIHSNTDVTSLLSDTATKAVVAYVSDYISKSALKTYLIFEAVKSVFDRNSEMLGGSLDQKEKAYGLLTQSVHNLTSKMEIGGPMGSMYLLKNADHYTNHKFQTFYWPNFVQAAGNTDRQNSFDDDINGADSDDENDKVTFHHFLKDHPLYHSHHVTPLDDMQGWVPNFVGGAIPRSDCENREYYCSTMLALFKPWRTGKDLKSEDQSWDNAFTTHMFNAKQLEIMKYFNVQYEWLDARDNYSAQMKKGARQMVLQAI